ncbi:DNA translocase FtsK [Ehrlichia minasensis]|uniref:DNA translocase FtsK n=2 Tax=Ehrlichia minasensis TaxID=1242993 RepID=A0A4Q6I4U6_9RICK|nr:DNA translocase FtsK [Ehrlichia minasensis]
MLCVTILGKIVVSMKSILNKTFFYLKIFLLSFITAFISLSIFTYHYDDLSFNIATDASVKNWGGVVGSHVADILIQIFGVASFVLIPLMIFYVVNVFYCVKRNLALYLVSSLITVIGVSGLVSSFKVMYKYHYGGVLGIYFQSCPVIVLLPMIVMGVVGVIGWQKILYLYDLLLDVPNRIMNRVDNVNNSVVKEKIPENVGQIQEFYDVEEDLLSEEEELEDDLTDEFTEDFAEGFTKELTEELMEESVQESVGESVEELIEELDSADEEELDFHAEEEDEEDHQEIDDNDQYDDEEEEGDEYDDEEDEEDDYIEDEYDEEKVVDNTPQVNFQVKPQEMNPSINTQIIREKKKNKEFILPSVDYLSKPNPINQRKFHPDDNVASLLDKVLKDFSIHGKIVNIRYGPVVTLYEFEPSAGTKSSRVIGLSDDIARSMSALSTRISVIPGRNVMGIELPNHYREIVMLRDLFESAQYRDSKLKLPIALGKGIDGEVVIADLVKMPHLLIAGTTGSGKSVAINTMILSLVYSLTPDQCKMIMIDPKVLELSVYNSIPHLLTPVVTESRKAIAALKWVVSEMENRYRLMSDVGARNIVGYNDKIKEAISENRTLEKILQTGFDKETGEAIFEKVVIEPRVFPYIVVIVDEMADLMLVAGKEIESSIQRLSQMARAAGIHIIMATQRPSVDVITGVIKANFPTRISFAVTSKIDSRTILGEQGAEQLLGMGDMLYMVSGGRVIRVHGAFVSDNEVQDIVEYLKSQGTPEYIEGITQVQQDYDYCMDDNLPERDDELYQQAVSIVMRDRRTSVSYIQRQLRIGYNRAANLVERMERDGVIGIANTGKREILLE